MFERGSATTAEVPTAKFAALTLTKSFNGRTPRDIDSLFWISVRGGVVATSEQPSRQCHPCLPGWDFADEDRRRTIRA